MLQTNNIQVIGSYADLMVYVTKTAAKAHKLGFSKGAVVGFVGGVITTVKLSEAVDKHNKRHDKKK